MPRKMYVLFYLRTQILPTDSYVLNSKSAAFQSVSQFFSPAMEVHPTYFKHNNYI